MGLLSSGASGWGVGMNQAGDNFMKAFLGVRGQRNDEEKTRLLEAIQKVQMDELNQKIATQQKAQTDLEAFQKGYGMLNQPTGPETITPTGEIVKQNTINQSSVGVDIPTDENAPVSMADVQAAAQRQSAAVDPIFRNVQAARQAGLLGQTPAEASPEAIARLGFQTNQPWASGLLNSSEKNANLLYRAEMQNNQKINQLQAMVDMGILKGDVAKQLAEIRTTSSERINSDKIDNLWKITIATLANRSSEGALNRTAKENLQANSPKTIEAKQKMMTAEKLGLLPEGYTESIFGGVPDTGNAGGYSGLWGGKPTTPVAAKPVAPVAAPIPAPVQPAPVIPAPVVATPRAPLDTSRFVKKSKYSKEQTQSVSPTMKAILDKLTTQQRKRLPSTWDTLTEK